MKVVGAGFGRTGTLTLKTALERLGFGPCYHMQEVMRHPQHAATWEAATRGEAVDWARFFEGWGSSVDWPACSFYQEILAAHPDAKVLLSVRDPERWHQSVLETIRQPTVRFPMRLFMPHLPLVGRVTRMASALVWEKTFQGKVDDREHAIAVYKAHIEEVKRTIPADRLLIFEARQGWGPLCAFLGVPVPDEPFPHVNDTASMRRVMGVMNAISWVLLLSPALLLLGLLLSLMGCGRDKAPETGAPTETGEGLMLAGCPEEGRATARFLTETAEAPWGPDVLAAPGDVVLMSERAAFVITAPELPETWYHYGGIPVDAVPLSGCEQSGPDTLEALGLVIGKLSVSDFQGSSLHQFRGDSLEIVSDGSDGEAAVVDVHGSDDRFWLVELTLLRESYVDGTERRLTDLYDLDVTVRYTLEPDSEVLQATVILDGEPADDGFIVGGLLFPSDYTELSAFSTDSLDFGGFSLRSGAPWIVDGGPSGSHAYAMPGASLALTSISGVTAMLDITQALAPLEVTAPGGPPEVPFLLSVTAGDPASAGAALGPYLDQPIPAHTVSWTPISGQVLDPAGTGVASAELTLEAQDDEGSWRTLDRLITGEDGAFSGEVLDVGTPWRLTASAAGRDDSETQELDPSDAEDLTLTVGAAGALRVHLQDEDGAALSGRVELERADGQTEILYAVPGDDPQPLAPGVWTAWVSRGYEHEVVELSVTVPEDGEATLSATLARVLDTSGWASMDTHVHAGPSPDSETLPVLRMRTAAASGLDLVVSTDHEAIVDLSDALVEAGVEGSLAYGLGSEVTCSVPEHVNAWPFPVEDGHARGEPVVWYGQGFPDVYAAIRERGASVIQLNHSRVNGECGILCVLDWDRQSEAPGIDDPTVLGMDEGEEVWSWDFDSFEVMNGLRSPFLVAGEERRSGALNDWMAFHNLGHRVAGVAVTDVHGPDIPGSPRTFVRVDDDEAVTADGVAEGVLAGATQLNAGAFIEASVDSHGPGEDVTSGGLFTLDLRVQALPEIDVTHADVLLNCEPLVTVEATDPDGVIKLETSELLIYGVDAWLIVIAYGEGAMPRGLEDYDAATVPRAITSPIFLDVDEDGVFTPPGPIPCDWAP